MNRRIPVLYNDADTWFHRRDPRAEFLFLASMFLGIYFVPSWQMMGVYALLAFGMVVLARVPWKYVAVLLLLQIPNVLTYLGFPVVSNVIAGAPAFTGEYGFFFKIVLSWQAALFLGIIAFTTMKITEFTDGLRGLGVPEVAAFTIEYIFLLLYFTLSDFWRIVDAMKLKGLKLETHNPVTLASTIPKMVIPFFITVLRRANTMMAVLKMRGYSFRTSGERRTDLKFDGADALLVILGGGVVVFIVALQFDWVTLAWLPAA